jgi:hypothetical protein
VALDKPVEDIKEVDLQGLIDAGIPELKTLDYKQTLPGTADEERREFLADVSSFANAAGGHLIYGMRADAGIPVELIGVTEGGDSTISRLEGSARDGIDPRIVGIHSTAVKLGNSRTAIVMRIPKSYSSPHMVKFKNASRFYSRASNGKYQLDVREIKAAFLNSETTAERIRDFQLERVSRIRARDLGISLCAGPCVVLHIIPLDAFGSPTQYDVTELKSNMSAYQALAPLFRQLPDRCAINFDGLLYHDLRNGGPSKGYLQLYRSGVIEAVDAMIISVGEGFKKGKVFSSLVFEVGLIRAIHKYLAVLKHIGVNPPFAVMVALTDVKGYALVTDRSGFFNSGPFDREVLMPREVIIDGYTADIPMVLKSVFDQIWNATDSKGSVYYKDGKWIGEEVARQCGGLGF